ncbi:MAG TPA: hypothetical protein VGR48_14345 [Terriglobales bacterium]|nr:hypothetical protein [Terriglobales bacterium]
MQDICCKLSRLAAVVVAILLSCEVFAQTTFPTVYVSTGAGQQILAIDGSSGTITGVCNVSFVPEDVVIGPDGNLYIANTTGNKIFRMSPTPFPAGNCTPEQIYDSTSSTCTDVNNNPLQCPTGPEGPSFLHINTLDLYFNTHGSSQGVWKIAAIANSGASSCTNVNGCAIQVLGPLAAGASGEGLDFDIFGNLLAVDQADNTVFRSVVNNGLFGPATALVTSSLSSPFGVALNTCGDVLVATGKSVNRYSSTTGALLDSLNFSGNNKPKFLEVDSADRLYVVTAQDESGKGGTVARFDPGSGNLNSCNLATTKNSPGFTKGFSLALNPNLVPGLATGNALGLGISASDVQIGPLPISSTPQLFSFGAQHTFSVSCSQVAIPFTMTVTALKSRPTDAQNAEVTFSPSSVDPTIPVWPAVTSPQCPVQIPDPVCVHYGSDHGDCIQYAETTDVDPTLACPGGFTFKVGYFAADFLADPGGAHSTGTGRTDQYTDCQSQDFYATAGPGLDSGGRLSGSNSKHVVFSSGLTFNGTITLNSPISSCQPTSICNPQFNAGQNINVKFSLTDATGGAITNATEQLSILLVQHTPKGAKQPIIDMVPQTVVATKNSAVANFFVPNSSGQYSYNDDSSAFSPTFAKGTVAIYQFNIWGNGAPPFSFNVTVLF